MYVPTKRHNLHTVFSYAGILCLRCKTCGHRRTLQIGSQGDMTPIHTLKFKCSECGHKDVEALIPLDYQEAMRFLKDQE